MISPHVWERTRRGVLERPATLKTGAWRSYAEEKY